MNPIIPILLRCLVRPSTACCHYPSAIHHFAASFMGPSSFVVLDPASTKDPPDTDGDKHWTQLMIAFGGMTATRQPHGGYFSESHTISMVRMRRKFWWRHGARR